MVRISIILMMIKSIEIMMIKAIRMVGFLPTLRLLITRFSPRFCFLYFFTFVFCIFVFVFCFACFCFPGGVGSGSTVFFGFCTFFPVTFSAEKLDVSVSIRPAFRKGFYVVKFQIVSGLAFNASAFISFPHFTPDIRRDMPASTCPEQSENNLQGQENYEEGYFYQEKGNTEKCFHKASVQLIAYLFYTPTVTRGKRKSKPSL